MQFSPPDLNFKIHLELKSGNSENENFKLPHINSSVNGYGGILRKLHSGMQSNSSEN